MTSQRKLNFLSVYKENWFAVNNENIFICIITLSTFMNELDFEKLILREY